MGNNTKNIIEINGKRYDAASGSYLGTGQAAALAVPLPSGRRRSVDGFGRASRAHRTQLRKPWPAVSLLNAKKSVPDPAAVDNASLSVPKAMPAVAKRTPHQPGINTTAHTPQRATTLMRSAVVKPVITSPAVIKARMRTDLLSKIPLETVKPKISYNSINKPRHLRAERMVKSPAVNRYRKEATHITVQSHPTPHVASVPVQPLQPLVAKPVVVAAMSRVVATATPIIPAVQSPVAPVLQPKPLTAPPAHVTVLQPAQHIAVKPALGKASLTVPPIAVQRPNATKVLAARPYLPSHSPIEPNQLDEASIPKPDLDIFEKALADASSHEQTYKHGHGRGHKRLLRVMGASIAGVVLLGFIVSQNMTSISVKVASYKSGLHATVPTQQPSGFQFGFLSYQPGNVTLNYASPHDGRQYNITQKASSWDSQALLTNFVASANSAYKTYQRAGRTVYLLSDDTATWVDSGIWYTIDGDSNLSPSQLLKIAETM